MNATPRIYVHCLVSYNDGNLHGEWIDAIDADEIKEGIADMLKASPIDGAEEYEIRDYEDFGCLSIHEHEDINVVAKAGRMIEEHGDAYASYANNVGIEYATESDFDDNYNGEWDTEEAYAENLWDECYDNDIPEHAKGYIDYARFARDLFMGDYYSLYNPSGGIFVFRSG